MKELKSDKSNGLLELNEAEIESISGGSFWSEVGSFIGNSFAEIKMALEANSEYVYGHPGGARP